MDQKIASKIISRLWLEYKELYEDLEGLSVNIPKSRIGDFGCGRGFITWCLKLLFPDSECIGLDKFDPSDPPEPDNFSEFGHFTIENIENPSRSLIEYLSSGVINSEDPVFMENLKSLVLEKQQLPLFKKANLETGEGLSPEFDSYFDLVYCKRVSLSIMGKDQWNERGIAQSFKNISRALKPKGWFCLVEIYDLSLNGLLKQAGFEFNHPRNVFRPYRTPLGESPSKAYNIFHCRKM